MSDDADERERAEAEALSRALEASGGDAGDDVRDALEAAALLRYGGGQHELPAERADAVLERLMPRVDAARPARAPRRLTRVVPIGALMLAAAAGAWLVISSEVARTPSGSAAAPVAPRGASASALPAPPQDLLAAQAALAGDAAARDRAAFDTAMRAYREQVLHALERTYPARLGMLEPRGAR